MVLGQVKRKLGNVIRKHVSQNGIPKHLSSLKDEAFKWYVDQGKFCLQALNRSFLKGLSVNNVLGLKYRLRFQKLFNQTQLTLFERKLTKTG